MITIRAATLDDAEAAAACHIACWREAYAGVVAPDVLAQRTSDLTERTARWRHIIASFPPRCLAVAEAGDVVGFSAAGPGRDDDVDVELELYALYVRAVHHGTGLADRLLRQAIGDAPAYLWVFEANPRARAFYARHRFDPDGVRKLDPFFEEPDIRMVRG